MRSFRFEENLAPCIQNNGLKSKAWILFELQDFKSKQLGKFIKTKIYLTKNQRQQLLSFLLASVTLNSTHTPSFICLIKVY